MRGTAGTPKGPASIHRARAALDQDGAVIGYAFESKGLSRIDIDTNESDPSTSLPDAHLENILFSIMKPSSCSCATRTAT